MDREYLTRYARELTDKGKLIEAGWVSLRLVSIPEGANRTQLEQLRNAFFAGAQHLFGSIMSIMDEDVEPTEKDMQRMSQIANELDEFLVDFKKQYGIRADD